MESSMQRDTNEETVHILKRIWSNRQNLIFEVFIALCLLPDYLTQVSVKRFPVEKACRLNYNYSRIVCAAISERSEFGIGCNGWRAANDTQDGREPLWNVTQTSSDFNYTVCKAEQQVQELTVNIFKTRSAVAVIVQLIVVLFVGSWSDRYNKRKPCVLIPLIGSILGYLVHLISSVFFHSISVEVGLYLEVLIPALFGGSMLFSVAVYTYLSAITPEPDRLLRFSVLFIIVNCLQLIAKPLGMWVYKELGYTNLFMMGLIFISLAFVYGLLFLEEVEPLATPNFEHMIGADNKGFDMNESTIEAVRSIRIDSEDQKVNGGEVSKSEKSYLARLLDPSLAVECIKLLLRKRPNDEQSLLAVLVVAYVLSLCPSAAEAKHWYNYTLRKLNWDGHQYSQYELYRLAIGIIGETGKTPKSYIKKSFVLLLGTFLGTVILSKIFKLSDPMLAIMATLSVIISRPIFAFAKSPVTVFIGGTVEMFSGLSAIVIRTLSSSMVRTNELGRMYSLLGISEKLAGFVFPYIYGYIYSGTVDTFPGAIYLLSELFAMPNILVFIGCTVLLKLRNTPGLEAVKTSDDPNEATRL